MTLATLTLFFQWCTVIGLAFYIWTAIMTLFGRNFLYSLHKTWFELKKDTFNIAIYAFLASFKLLLIVFILVPYLALLVIGK